MSGFRTSNTTIKKKPKPLVIILPQLKQYEYVYCIEKDKVWGKENVILPNISCPLIELFVVVVC